MADSEVTTAITEILQEHRPDAFGYCGACSELVDADPDHIADVLQAAFVLVPKDQLHQETAEQACSSSDDLREQTKPQGDSASGPLDAVAQAIADAAPPSCVPWNTANESWREVYRRMAQAAVDAMELRMERIHPDDPIYDFRQSRLVGSWRPADSKEQANG